MKKFYITTPIYYVNASPHIGHTYTTIAADVFARYYRKRFGSDSVFYLTGTDEHGGKIYEKALDQGKDTQLFCDEIAQRFKDVWSAYDISYDKFIRTTDLEHKDFVKNFMLTLKTAGALYESEYSGLYCVGCEKFITEKELIDGKCQYHKTEPEIICEKNWFFNLQKYLPNVISLIENDELNILPLSAKSEVLSMAKQGVPDFSVSRSKDKVRWGIELPWDDTQLVYVWCDALTNYLSGISSQNMDWWPADLHLMAMDIVKFHALYWPALLLASGYVVPKTLFVHGFFTVNGNKMSKSLGNVIDPMELLEEFGPDASKYLLLTQFPFGHDGDIDKERLIEKYNSELADGLGNLFNRITTLTEKYFNGKAPGSNDFTLMSEVVSDTWSAYTECMENTYRLDVALFEVRKLVSFCDKDITDGKLWELCKTDIVRAGEMIYNVLEALIHISLMIEPFLPETALRIQSAFSFDNYLSADFYSEHKWGILPLDTVVSKKDILFPKKK